MRKLYPAALALWTIVACGPAHALKASDKMAAWRGATADVRARLVTDILKQDGREASTANVVKCLDAAAEVPGHSDLPIRQVVQACAKENGEPV